jgi:hypothetical protein
MDEDDGVEMPKRRRGKRGRRRRKKEEEEDNEDNNEEEEKDDDEVNDENNNDDDDVEQEEEQEEKDGIDENKGGRQRRKRRDRKKKEAQELNNKEPVGNSKSRRAKLRGSATASNYTTMKIGSGALAGLMFIACFAGYFHTCMVHRSCMNNVDPAVPQGYTDSFIPFIIFGLIFSLWGYGAAMSESYGNLFVYAVFSLTYSIVVIVYGGNLADMANPVNSATYASKVYATLTSVQVKYYPTENDLTTAYQKYTSTYINTHIYIFRDCIQFFHSTYTCI